MLRLFIVRPTILSFKRVMVSLRLTLMEWQVDDRTSLTPRQSRTQRVGAWFLDNSAAFVVAKDIATIIAATIAAISLFFAANQLHNTANSIKSNAVFQLTREGMNLAKSIDEESLRDPRTGGNIFSFMNLVWNQHQLGVIDDELWRPMSAEICIFLKTQNIEIYWNNDNKRMYSTEFVKFIDDWSKNCQSTLARGRS
jgi:hypothetical protein